MSMLGLHIGRAPQFFVACAVATLGLASPAGAQDQTYLFIGGDLSWAPDGGNVEQSTPGPGPVTLSRVLTDVPFGTATAEARAAAGLVGASVVGEFTNPALLSIPFDPTIRATSRVNFVITGPPAPAGVPVSFNLHLDGMATHLCGGMPTCRLTYDIRATIGFTEVGRLAGTYAGVTTNSFSGPLDVQTGPVLTIQGDVTTASRTLQVNSPQFLQLSLALAVQHNGLSTATTASFDVDFLDIVSFSRTGPVFNVPAGYTVEASNVVGNVFQNPFAPASISFVGTTAATIVCPALVNVPGDVIIAGNAEATLIDCHTLETVDGSIDVSNNGSATSIGLGSLQEVGGTVINIANNGSATSIDLGSLQEVGGTVINIANNGSATSIDLGSLQEVGGTVINIANNGSATSIDLGSLQEVGGTVINIANNGSATSIDLGSLQEVGGLNISTNGPCTTVLLGPLATVTGDLTVETCGTGTFSTGALVPGGASSVTATGYSTVGGTTALGGTTLTHIVGAAAMRVQLPADAFTAPTSFTIAHMGSAALPAETGTDASGGIAAVDPLAAYQIVFGVPVLNSPATLSFMVDVAALDDATRTALLDALSAGLATLVTRADTGGSLQAFPLCGSIGMPVQGCVLVQTLDANGQETFDPPAFVQFTSVVGHFSTWAVAIITPCTLNYSISPASAQFTNGGGTGTIDVTAPAACPWTASSSAPWLTISVGAIGSGQGSVAYAVDSNAGPERSGELTIAGFSFLVTQEAAPAGAADLAIGNAAWPLVRTGRTLTYLMAAVNRGPETASNVVISDALPAGTTFVRAVWAPVGCTSDGTNLTCFPPSNGTPCTVSGGVVSCAVGTLPPIAPGNWVGAGVLVEVVVTAPPGTTLVNVATVGASTADPAPDNNANSATTRVVR